MVCLPNGLRSSLNWSLPFLSSFISCRVRCVMLAFLKRSEGDLHHPVKKERRWKRREERCHGSGNYYDAIALDGGNDSFSLSSSFIRLQQPAPDLRGILMFFHTAWGVHIHTSQPDSVKTTTNWRCHSLSLAVEISISTHATHTWPTTMRRLSATRRTMKEDGTQSKDNATYLLAFQASFLIQPSIRISENARMT